MVDRDDDVLAALTRTLVERFAPERIVLFGSRARGDHHPESDYDVLMVLGDVAHSEEDVRSAVVGVHSNVEIFVDTGDRFERRRTDVGTLEYVAEDEGRVLYARARPEVVRRVRETPPGPPESLSEWVTRAENDFAIMELVLNGAPRVRDGIVFHAHQGVEKLIKAVLVARRVRPPRTHDLTELLLRLPDELRDGARLGNACVGLQKLWPSSRYPDVQMPPAAQVEQAVEWARQIRQLLGPVIGLV